MEAHSTQRANHREYALVCFMEVRAKGTKSTLSNLYIEWRELQPLVPGVGQQRSHMQVDRIKAHQTPPDPLLDNNVFVCLMQ